MRFVPSLRRQHAISLTVDTDTLADPQEPLCHIADPPASRLRLRGVCSDNRCSTCRRSAHRLLRDQPLRRFERRRTARPISLHGISPIFLTPSSGAWTSRCVRVHVEPCSGESATAPDLFCFDAGGPTDSVGERADAVDAATYT